MSRLCGIVSDTILATSDLDAAKMKWWPELSLHTRVWAVNLWHIAKVLQFKCLFCTYDWM